MFFGKYSKWPKKKRQQSCHRRRFVPGGSGKATVAAVTEDMKVDGKGKTKEVDLKKDYVKKLPPAVRRKVRNYNVSNLTPEERKKYREKRKILRMSGRIKPKKPEKEIKPENSFVNEKAAELQASVTGKMMPQDMSGFGRE